MTSSRSWPASTAKDMKRKSDIKQAKELQKGLDEMSAIIAEEEKANEQI